MCGIAALFGKTLDQETLAALVPMTRLVSHRGPDGEGFQFFAPAAALGHRRLAIVDLSQAGLQPMGSPCGRYWITFNGEIYNYKELRKELGGVFQTETDTEVILAAYAKWGVEALQRFNGMFAFAIYDRQENTLFAARDRFGVKPLYYWQMPSGAIALASEIKQLTCLPRWKAVLNGQKGHDFLNWGVKDHTSETLFQGVFQLRGGEYLHLKPGEPPRPRKWYEIPYKPFQGTFKEASQAFNALLKDAVALRLRADVAVGSCLSGGLDSSSIVCLAKGQLKSAFIARSDQPQFDESAYADLAVKESALSPHYVTPTLDSLLKSQAELAWHQDEPFTSTSQFAQWSVFKLVKRQGIKVVLNGQGSDEQLAGYPGFFGNRFYDLFKGLQWIKLRQEMAQAKNSHPHLQPLALLGNKLTPDVLRQPMRKLLNKSSERSGWFDYRKMNADPRDPFLNTERKSVADQCRQQLLQSSLPMLLHYEDRNSMAHSVESRVPFLDYRIVEFLNGLPSDFKIGEGCTKKVLREALRGVLPEAIRLRQDKMGFVTAEEVWMRKDAPQLIREKIERAMARSQGIILPEALCAVDLILDGKRPFDFLLWRLISFGDWLERFEVHVP